MQPWAAILAMIGLLASLIAITGPARRAYNWQTMTTVLLLALALGGKLEAQPISLSAEKSSALRHVLEAERERQQIVGYSVAV